MHVIALGEARGGRGKTEGRCPLMMCKDFHGRKAPIRSMDDAIVPAPVVW